MYIEPFWVGVIATVLVEVAVVVVAVGYSVWRDNKKNK